MQKTDEIQDSDSLVKEFKRINNPNILLGNGFNICLGINTSYKSLFNSLITQKYIKEIMNLYKGLEEKNHKKWV